MTTKLTRLLSYDDPDASVPGWDVHDRLRKSLRASNVGVAEMADFLEVSRNSVSNWLNGHVEPTGQTLHLWAIRTGVPREWLRNGDAPTEAGACPACAARESNPQPADKGVGRHLRLVPPLPPPRHLQAVRVAA